MTAMHRAGEEDVVDSPIADEALGSVVIDEDGRDGTGGCSRFGERARERLRRERCARRVFDDDGVAREERRNHRVDRREQRVVPRGEIEHDAKRLLSEAGVPVVRETLCATVEEAAAATATLGYPVALKLVADDVPHRSDLGLVAVGLRDARDLAEAWARMAAIRAEKLRDVAVAGFVVQPTVRGGVEVPLSYSLAARLTGELVANLARPELRLPGGATWSVVETSGAGALQFVASF